MIAPHGTSPDQHFQHLVSSCVTSTNEKSYLLTTVRRLSFESFKGAVQVDPVSINDGIDLVNVPNTKAGRCPWNEFPSMGDTCQ
jgi:hypothetical protein